MKFMVKQETSKNVQDKKQVQALYDSFAQQYTRNYLNPTSLFGLEKQQRLKIVRHHLQELQPRSVLDLGCGPGYTTSMVASDLSNATVVGVDFSPEMIEVARQNHSQMAFFLQGDAENLPFESKRFSAIFALGLLEKFENPLYTLTECYRALIPGGHLYFTYPNRFSFLRIFHRWIGSFLGENTGVQDQSMFSGEGMRRILNQVGFKVLEITFLTYGNGFILFPWSEKIDLVMEKHLGKNNFGHAISMTSFWSLQKTPPVV